MLRSETYVQNLLKGLNDLKERNVGCDLTLSSKDGSSFAVHRIVMAAASSYFMLRLDNEISSGQIHVLKNIDSSCLEALVNFAYTGELDLTNIPKTAIWPMLSACTELQMTDALNLCHDYMAGNVTPSKPTRSGRNVQSQLPVKMEVDAHGVKQEGYDTFDQSFDNDYADDDDNYPGPDGSYYTGDNYNLGEGMAVVQLTPLEDDQTLSQKYSDQLTPIKRGRGRPKKSATPVGRPKSKAAPYTDPIPRRGRPPKGKTTPAKAVVEYSQTTPRRGRPRKGSSPASAGPKSTPKERKRKRPAETVKGEKCESCGKVLKLKALLAVHKRIKHNHRTYAHNLHRKVAHWNISSQVIVQQDFETQRNVFACNRCGEMFNMWTRWRKHYLRKHFGRLHECAKCKIGFSYPLDLYHHKHKKHKSKIVLKKRAGIRLADSSSAVKKKGQQWVSILNLPQAATESKKIQAITATNLSSRLDCGVCGKQCTSTKSLQEHIGRHWKSRYQCTHCDRSFALKMSLKDHIRGVHQGQRLPCPVEGCTGTFLSKKILNAHMKIHNSEYAYKCEICDKGVMYKSQLDSHMNRHYGIKPYECAICGRKYFHSTDLTRHVRYCGEEKTEKCHLCGKAFACEKYVREHLRSTHQMGQPYLCNVCGRAFYYRSAISNHMKTHATDT